VTTATTGGPGAPTPIWFGPAERPLFGWLHLPRDRTVRGGVVLCQPLGIEAICAYYAYRILADRLAEQGLAVLRFDYDGTGDSVGEETDPDRVAAWLGSLDAAANELVATGVPSVALVGMRLGALFAAHEAARRGGVDALVLWDPSVSGKSFLREQRFLRQVSGGASDRDDGALDAPGIRFESDTVEALVDLDLTEFEGTLAKRTLVLLAPGTTGSRSLRRRLDGLDVDWQEAAGQDLLLDSRKQEPPMGTIGHVVDWLTTELRGAPTTVAEVAPGRNRTVVATKRAGQPVVEEAVTFGDLPLFGIVTAGEDAVPGTTVVLVNEGNTHHIGQARLWVDLARRLGSAGFRTLRYDLSGNGDSGTRPGQHDHVAVAPEAIDDVYEAMRSFSTDDPTDVVLVGFCSGAYSVIEQALRHPPRGICVISPAFTFTLEGPDDPAVRQARQRTKPWFVRLVGPPLHWVGTRSNPTEVDRWMRALENGAWPVAVAQRRPGVPEWVWRFVHLHLLEDTGISTLERIDALGVDTFLVCGNADFIPIAIGSGDRIRMLEQSPHFHLNVVDELDHAAWSKEQRELLVDLMVEHFERRWPPPAASRRPATD